jgi:intracellular septation protein
MKLLYDFFPLILFFLAFKLFDIYIATTVAIAASVLQITLYRLKHRRFEKMHLISAGLMLVFGGLTIVLQDRSFVMWKPTILYWLFTGILFGVYVGSRRSTFRGLLAMSAAEEVSQIPDDAFRKVDLLAGAFFLLLGCANLWFAYRYFGAETLLWNTYPEMTSAQLKELNCGDFPQVAQDACAAAKGAENSWVNFKTFGSLGLTFVFMFAVSYYLVSLSKQAPAQDASE